MRTSSLNGRIASKNKNSKAELYRMFMVYSMEDIFIAMVLMTEILICNGELPTSERTVKPSELNIDIMFTLWLLGSHLYW